MEDEEPAPAEEAQAPFAAHSLDDGLQLWRRVERYFSVSGGVAYSDAVQSLSSAHYYSRGSADARAFIDKCMARIVHVLLEQDPADLDKDDIECVEQALLRSLRIIDEDLDRIGDSGVCSTFGLLGSIFTRTNMYYKERKGVKLRRRMIASFQNMHGFRNLIAYLNARVNTPQFPDMLLVSHLLRAMHDVMPPPIRSQEHESFDPTRDEAYAMVQLVMKHLEGFMTSDNDATEGVEKVLPPLNAIYCKLSEFDPQRFHFDLRASFTFWRRLTLKMMHSNSHQVMLYGWDQIADLVEASERMRPPPRAYLVEGAGTDYVNGEYVIDPSMTTELGHAKPFICSPGGCWQYHRTLSRDLADAEGNPVPWAGKTLTLFRCTMRSQHKWWFLSIPDEDEPGTDKDVDYYQHKSKREELQPSLSGWLTCRAGQDPAPSLKTIGLMVPQGEEERTSDRELAKWAIENKLVELALGDSTNAEIVKRAPELVKFLARMCNDAFASPKKHCLQASHLSVASQSIEWTTDAMASAQMHLLLLTIHESLPERLREMIPRISTGATLRRIELNDPTLLKLKVGSSFALDSTDEEMGVFDPAKGSYFSLGHFIGANTHLEDIHFDSSIDAEDVDPLPSNDTLEQLFEGLQQNSSIKSLELDNCAEISQATGAEILTAFRERTVKLAAISLFDYNLENGGVHALASLLGACPDLKKIDLPGNTIADIELVEIIAAIRDHSQLETLVLSDNSIADVDPLVGLLSSPQCSLVTLSLNNNQIDSGGAIALARALTRNRRLVKLDLAENGRIVWGTEAFEAFSQLICDTSSVNATYLSNHNLESIGFSVDSDDNLRHNLRLNASADKKIVAMKKTLCYHAQIDMMPLFEWDLKALPLAVRWFDEAKALSDELEDDYDWMRMARMGTSLAAGKLEAIYQFTRAMPTLLVAPALRDGAGFKRESEE